MKVVKLLIQDLFECKNLYNRYFPNNKLHIKQFDNCYKLCENNKFIGFGNYSLSKSNCVFLDNLFIEQNYQHRGGGTLLLSTIIKYIEQQNKQFRQYQKITVGCNIPEFYSQFGFIIVEDFITLENGKEIIDATGARYVMEFNLTPK